MLGADDGGSELHADETARFGNPAGLPGTGGGDGRLTTPPSSSPNHTVEHHVVLPLRTLIPNACRRRFRTGSSPAAH